MLDMKLRDIESVLYFESFVVTDPGMTDLTERQLLTEEQYMDALTQYGDDFTAKMGAEAWGSASDCRAAGTCPAAGEPGPPGAGEPPWEARASWRQTPAPGNQSDASGSCSRIPRSAPDR